MSSILKSIKKVLGVPEEYDHFDRDLILHINTTLSILTQLGVGDPKGFSVMGEEEQWEDFINDSRLAMVKSYMVFKVRLLFDPPLSSAVLECINRQLDELEWRINTCVETEEGLQNG